MARYIDADAVIAKIKAEHCDKCNHNERCFYCDFDKALMLLEEADDADKVSTKNIPLITHIAGYPINDVIDLMEAKNAGRIVELPCAVGDTVYRITGNYCGEKIFEGVVDQIAIFNNGVIRFWVFGHPLGFACDDIGKTVFLTKEEAERAIKEKQQ